jgi:hypothetical protein
MTEYVLIEIGVIDETIYDLVEQLLVCSTHLEYSHAGYELDLYLNEPWVIEPIELPACNHD